MKKVLFLIACVLSISLPSNAKYYDYDVSGHNSFGNHVSGEIEADGSKYGEGTIRDENGNEKHIDFEWTGKGEVEATDEDGETYDLEVD